MTEKRQELLPVFISQMNPLVCDKSALIRKRLSANVTCERFLARVYADVFHQAEVKRKCFITIGTFSWTLSIHSHSILFLHISEVNKVSSRNVQQDTSRLSTNHCLLWMDGWIYYRILVFPSLCRLNHCGQRKGKG